MRIYAPEPAQIATQSKTNLRTEELYQNVQSNEIKYNTLSMKLDANVTFGTQTQNFQGIVRIKKDSIIWVSFRKLNFEGARICITKDTITFIDRLNNTYYQKDYPTFAENFGLDLDYSAFEAIFTNSFFFYPCSDEPDLIKNFQRCSDKENYCISSLSKKRTSRYFNEKLFTEKYNKKLQKELSDSVKKNIDDFVFQIVNIRHEFYKIANVYLENNIDQQSAYISYANFTNKFNQYFPQNINIELKSKQMSFSTNLFIIDVSFNPNDLTYPIKITKLMKEMNLKFE